jgi:CRISPR type I-E-associated protein CasB/Cse2
MSLVPEHEDKATSPRDLPATITRIAMAIAHELPPGNLAALRRLDPDNPSSPAFYRVLAAHVEPTYPLPAGGAVRDEAERRWAVILSGMVQLEHQARRGLGRAAAEAGLSEMRFSRLLRDGGRTLAATVRAVVHFLAVKNESVDWVDFAKLVLSEGNSWGEGVRRSLARDYYGQTHRLEVEGRE